MSGMILESRQPLLLWPVLIVFLLTGALGVFFDRWRAKPQAKPRGTSPEHR